MSVSVLNLRSLTPGVQPLSLEPGQLCFNLPDRLMFVGDGSDFKTPYNGAPVPGIPGEGWFAMPMDVSGLGEGFLVSPNYYGQTPTNGQIVQWNSSLGHLEWVNPSSTGSDSAGYLTDNAAVTAAAGVTVTDKLNTVIAPAVAEEGNTCIVQGVSGDQYEGVYTYIQGAWEFGSFYALPVAAAVSFDPAGTNLTSSDVQGAIVELDLAKVQVPVVPPSAGQVLGWSGSATEWVDNDGTPAASAVTYNNTSSGLSATNVQDAIDQTVVLVNTAQADADAAAITAGNALSTATNAQTDATQALADALAAQNTANTALVDAANAQSAAGAAQLDATQALADAANAQTDATQALADAADAQATADAALPKAGGVMTGIISFDAAQPTATTLAPNIVRLTDSTTSTSTTTAATPNSVKLANDNADTRLSLAGGTMTGVIVFDAGQTFPVSGIQGATTTQSGVVQLDNSTTSTSLTEAPTANVLRLVHLETVGAQATADAALAKTGGTMTGAITFASGQIFPVSGIVDATPLGKGVVQVGTHIQVASGVISVLDATTSQQGVVQLTDALNLPSSTLGLTAYGGYQLQQQIDTLSLLSNLTFCGTINATTGLLTSVTDAGITHGFAVGNPLPTPAALTNNHFVVVSIPGTFTPTGGSVPLVCNQGDWIVGVEPTPSTYEWSLQPVGYDAPSATTTVEGIVYLATDAEVQAGTDATKAVVSSALQSKLSDSTSTTSSTTIASSTAVKSAYDLADAAMPKSGGNFTGNVTFDPGTVITVDTGTNFLVDGTNSFTGSTTFEGSSSTTFDTGSTVQFNTSPSFSAGNGVVFSDASTVKAISDSVSLTSSITAASSTAVKAAYDAAVTLAPQASAATLFVNVTTGNNATAARGTAKPYSTLTAALAAASNGDTIFVAPGTYPENVTLSKGVSIIGTYVDQAISNGPIFSGTFTVSITGVGTTNWAVSNLRFLSGTGTNTVTVSNNSFASGGLGSFNNCFFGNSSAAVADQCFTTSGTWTRSLYLRNCTFDGNFTHNAGTAAGASGYIVIDNLLGIAAADNYYRVITGTCEFRNPSNAMAPVIQSGGVFIVQNALGWAVNSATTTSIFGGTGFSYKGTSAALGSCYAYFTGQGNTITDGVTWGKVSIGTNVIYAFNQVNFDTSLATLSGSPLSTVAPNANAVQSFMGRPQWVYLKTASSVTAAQQLGVVLNSSTGTVYTVSAYDAGSY